MADETRVLRNAQANLIAIQAARIALLEARLDVANRRVAELEAEKKKSAESRPMKGVQA